MTTTQSPTETTSVVPHGTGPNGARLFLVPSQSNPDDTHVVAFINGTTSCTCDGSFYRGHCRHGRAVEEFLSMEQRAAWLRRERDLSETRRIMTNRLMGRPDDYAA